MVPSVPQIRVISQGLSPLSGVSPLPNMLTPAKVSFRFRRVPRSHETGNRAVTRALPDGFQRPDHTDEVLEAFNAHPSVHLFRSDRREKLRRCLEFMVSVADFATMTIRPTRQRLAEVLGVHVRSVSRYTTQLREMQLLGLVAGGRSAKYATVGEDGQRINEAAVWVFCVPEKRRTVANVMRRVLGMKPMVGDRSVTPPTARWTYLSNKRELTHARTREGRSISEEQKKIGWSIDQVRWNKHWPAHNRPQQLSVARRLKTQLPNVLGLMSIRDIASTLRSFLEAQWTTADLLHALEFRPDHSRWPYSGAPETKSPHRIRGWLRFRLAAWCDDSGKPFPSRDAEERKARVVQRQQAQKARQADLRSTKKAAPGDSPVKQKALERIRYVLRSQNRKPLINGEA